MFSHCKLVLVLLLVLAFDVCSRSEPATRVLRIAADPNNLPFSNQKCEGFENRIADLIARDLHAEIQYTWRAQRRGFFRETLKTGECDMVLGVPVGFDKALVTRPYYRSGYVFVSPSASQFALTSLADPTLRTARIGVQLIGDDGANTPPAHALAARGIITNVLGFTVYGDYREPNPPARIVDAVAHGEVDTAIVWGPVAGYFAKQKNLNISLLKEASDAGLPLQFDIGIGVSRKNSDLRDELNAVLARHEQEIKRILNDFSVPQLPVKSVASETREAHK